MHGDTQVAHKTTKEVKGKSGCPFRRINFGGSNLRVVGDMWASMDVSLKTKIIADLNADSKVKGYLANNANMPLTGICRRVDRVVLQQIVTAVVTMRLATTSTPPTISVPATAGRRVSVATA